MLVDLKSSFQGLKNVDILRRESWMYTIQAHSDTHLGVVVVLQTDLSVSVYTIPTLCFNLREETINHKLLYL